MSGIRYKQIRDIDKMPYYILASGNTISNPATNIYSQVISATTYYNLPTDIRVTGATYSNNTFTYTNNTGGTFNVNFNTVTGLTVNGDLTVTGVTSFGVLTATTISATTISGGTIYANDFPQLPYTDGQTIDYFYSGDIAYIRVKDTVSAPSGGTRTFIGNVNVTSGFTANTISASTYYNLPTDIRVTGGTYTNGTIIFTNNTGGTFNVTGLYTGYTPSTDIFVTGATYSNNTFTYTNNTGGTFNVNFNTLTGLTINGNLNVTGGTSFGTLTATTISATTISGGTIYANDFPQLPYSDGETIDYFISGSYAYLRVKESVAAPSGGTRTFVGNVNVTSGFTANTISATTYYNLPVDVRVTGGTYSNGSIVFTNNTGGTFNVTGLYTGYTAPTDIYVTGATYSNNTFTYTNNTGNTFSVNFNTLTGLTINGDLNVTGGTSFGTLTATTISATTISGNTIYANDFPQLPYTDGETIDYYVSGSTTYIRVKDSVAAPSGGTRTFVGNVNVTSGFTANTISAATYYNLPYSGTVNGGGTVNYVSKWTGNTALGDSIIYDDGTNVGIGTNTPSSKLDINGSVNIASGLSNTSARPAVGTSVLPNGEIHSYSTALGPTGDDGFLRLSSGGGTTPFNKTYIDIAGYSENNELNHSIVFGIRSGERMRVDVNGNLGIGTSSPTEKLHVSGNTLISGGLTATTISATTYYNLPTDVRVTGGTYSNGTLVFTNNTGGTFNVTGLYTGGADVFVTGATYSNNTFTYTNNTGGTFNVSFNTVTGLTVNGDLTVTGVTSFDTLTATTISATTISGDTIYANDFPQLPYTDGETIDYYISGSTTYIRVKDTVSAPSGGTRTFVGNVNVTSGLTANTISATTYYNLPIDVFVTGGTYDNNTGVATFTNNTGGTFNVSGFFNGGDDTYVTGVTFNNGNYDLTISRNDGVSFTQSLSILATDMVVTGGTYNPTTGTATFTNNSGGTFNVTGFLTGMTDTYVTGLTFNNNVLTLKQTNNQSDISVLVNDLSGLTINGNLNVTGNTILGSTTATTISATTYYNLPYSGTVNGGGTVNYVSKWTGATALGDSIIYDDGSNVGIGITSPTAKLHITNTGSSDSFLVEDSTNPDSTAFIIDNAGLVGIGRIPTTALDVNGNIRLGNITGFTSTINQANIASITSEFIPGTGPSYVRFRGHTGSAGSQHVMSIGGHGRIGIGTQSPTATLHITNTGITNSFLVEDSTNPDSTPFVITNDGNVGIGTTTPTYKLEMIGDGSISYTGVTVLTLRNTLVNSVSTSGITAIYLGDASSGVNMIQREKVTANTAGINLYAEYGYNVQSLVAKFQYNLAKIYTAGIQRFYLDGNGNVVIGDNINPSAKLHVNNTTADNSFLVEDSTNPDSSPFVIDNAGNVGVGTTTPTAKLDVLSTSVPSSGETIAQFKVSDDINSYLKITNATSTNSVFVPTIIGKQSSDRIGLFMIGDGTTDTGNTPLTVFDSRIGNTNVVTRPLFRWDNYGTPYMTMNASGYLGIGTTTPTAILHVVNPTFGSDYSFIVQDENPDSSPFVIDSSGNVGIGVTVPTQKLHVSGNALISGGLTATTISATTYYNLPTDVFVTGGTYSNNTFTYTNNTGGTFNITFNSVTGLTVNGDLTVTGNTSLSAVTATTMSATTYYGDGSNLTGISAAATEFVVNCRNQSGSDMYRGQIVYMNGSTGNKPTILLAQANSEMTSARTFGVLKNNITNNADGDVVVIGSITNLDTRTTATHPFTVDTLVDGQTLYLSPTNAGYVTNVKPYAPNHLVYIGKVVRTSPTNGYIEYQIQNGYELDELHDVQITGTTISDETIIRDAVTGLWKNSFIPPLSPQEIFRGITFRNNSTTIDTYGGIVTSTSASNLALSVSSTDFKSKQIRLRYYASVVTTGRYTGVRGSSLLWYIGGGFRFVCDWNISDTAYASNTQQFFGLASQTTDLNYGDITLILVSTLTNIIGVGNEIGDSNLQIFYNDASGTASKIDLGSGFPANRTSGATSTTVYSVEIYNPVSSTEVRYKVTNKETGEVAQGSLTTNIPATTAGLTFFASRTMGSPTTNTGQFDLLKLGVYSLL